MNKKEDLSLIEGTFSPAEAEEVLSALFSSKLKFHELKNLSSIERFGKTDKAAEKRILKLKETLKIMAAVIQEAKRTKSKLNISSQVSVQLVEPKNGE